MNVVTKHASNPTNSNNAARSVATGLHPRVYAALIGFTIWFALAVWSFAGSGITDYLLVIVSSFIFVIVALQFILLRVGHKGDGAASRQDEPSLCDWAAADFEIWQDRLSGAQAALHILLPIGAAAVGMTVFGIAFHIAEHGA